VEDFTAAAEKASSFTDLYEAMIALYPDRLNRVRARPGFARPA
jgi:hypothetical protein